MYEKLTEKFLSMEWDKNYLTKLDTSFSEDTIVSLLDQVLPDWTFKITNMVSTNNGICVGGTLFLPGRTLDGTGHNEWSAICNIITKLTTNVNQNSQTIVQEKTQEKTAVQNNNNAKITTASVLNQLNQISNNIANQNASVNNTNNNTNDISKDIFSNLFESVKQEDKKTEESVNEPTNEVTYVEFGSPEQEQFDKEFFDSIKESKPIKQPTPEEVNPTGQIIPKSAWTTEAGQILKNWMQEHNVTAKEQIDAWLKKYCGLTYDYFDPKWVSNFVEWTKDFREQQTY